MNSRSSSTQASSTAPNSTQTPKRSDPEDLTPHIRPHAFRCASGPEGFLAQNTESANSLHQLPNSGVRHRCLEMWPVKGRTCAESATLIVAYAAKQWSDPSQPKGAPVPDVL